MRRGKEGYGFTVMGFSPVTIGRIETGKYLKHCVQRESGI